MRNRAWAVGLLLVAGRVQAQDRPVEDEMFGGGGEATTATTAAPPTGTSGPTPPLPPPLAPLAPSTTTATAAASATGSDSRDALNLSDPKAATRFSAEVAPEDPLKIGGQLYWRVTSTGRQGQYPQNWSLSAPALLDVYMDARPNERVRAFALGRMSYDPTLAPNGSSSSSAGAAGATATSGTSAQSGDSTTLNLFGQQTQTRGPNAVLDQMWLRFDLLRTVFVTAGKQHARWGTARFWTPTDYLHLQPRNPLLPFDARTGTTMLKLHLPWEKRGWNFYAYALPENVDASQAVKRIAGAARAEVVFGTLEAGAGVFGRSNAKAKFAGDVSFGLWDLDFYGEVAVRNAGDVDFLHYKGGDSIDCSTAITPANLADTTSLFRQFYDQTRGSGWKAQATGGVSYTRQYADKDTFTVGAEYFYNGLGYASPKDYLGLFALSQSMANPATFFYLGRQYLAVFATAPSPYSWDNTTFTLSNLMNLTDESGITRFDYSLTVLTHVRFEAYGAVHWGQRNGEFRLGFNLPCPDQLQALGRPSTSAPSLFDLGVGLRVAL